MHPSGTDIHRDAAPSGFELTGDGSAAAGVRWSDVLGAGVVGLVAMGLLPPYARDGGSSRCQGVHRAGGAGRERRERNGGQARTACGAQLSDQPNARPGLFTAAPNVSKLSGERSESAEARCSATQRCVSGFTVCGPRLATTLAFEQARIPSESRSFRTC